MNKLLRKNEGMNGILLSFLLSMAGALAFFLPFLVIDQGFFLYAGDYNSQQIPFYTYVHQFIKSGGGSWSWATDLGSSIVNSYSFYNLGSPFLWLSLLFPNRWMPYLMVPILILKFGCIGAAANLYLSRYAKTRNMAVIVSVVYALCGFNVYNIFFNHMLEPVIYFPLMLWALDGFVLEKRRGMFALFVGLALVNSYFFFLGNVVFLLLYFFVKLACGEYKLDWKNFGLLVMEAVIGVGLGMVLALPAFYNLIGNPRTDNFSNGFGLLLYGNVQQYFEILLSMFFPPDPPYLPNLFTEGAIKWTSMSLYLPLVGMGSVCAYCMRRRGGSIKVLLFISLVMAMVPILNSSFYAFNASYYARWYYMPLLIGAFATMRSLEDVDINLERGARLGLILTAVWAVFGLLPNKKDGEWKLGVSQYESRFWLMIITGLLGAGAFYLIVRRLRGRVRFAPVLLSAVMAFSVFYSVVHLATGKMPQWQRDSYYKEQQYDGSAQLQLPDDSFYRIDAYEAYDNLGLWLDKSCLQTFNSVVTTSIMEFYPMVGVKRDVSSKPETTHYALRGLLSVRYTVMPHQKEQEAEAAGRGEEYQTAEEKFLAAPGTDGWTRWKEEGPFVVYENQNFVPLGFTYNAYIPMANLEGIRVDDRAPVLMRGIGLDEEQEGKYRRLFDGKAVDWVLPAGSNGSLTGQTNADGTAETRQGGWYQYDPVNYTRYVEDCNARRATASNWVRANSSGFAVGITLPKENLVFFAVPYDPGFTATVNGQPAQVEKVSGGMMAVLAPAGENEIVFTYETPGFKMGMVISLVALLALLFYGGTSFLARRRVQRAAHASPSAAAAQEQSHAAQAVPLLPQQGHLAQRAGNTARPTAGSKAHKHKVDGTEDPVFRVQAKELGQLLAGDEDNTAPKAEVTSPPGSKSPNAATDAPSNGNADDAQPPEAASSDTEPKQDGQA